MGAPILAYYAAICLIAFPSIPFNRMASIVIGAWLVGQFGYVAGIPVDWCDTVGYSLGAILGLLCASRMRMASAWASAAAFVPMTGIAVGCATGAIHPYYAWWSSYWFAMTQIAFLPFCNDWRTVGEGVEALRDKELLDKLLRVAMRWAC